MQATINSEISFKGVGLHSGKISELTLIPAEINHGIWFKRTDILGTNNMIEAIYSNVNDKPLCTRLENECGVSVSTVEHLMAALAGCGVQNIFCLLYTSPSPRDRG